jgi:RNA polymerase sigma-70 factor (ECF subfamily)
MNIQVTENEIINGCIQGTEKYQKMLYYQYFSKMMSVCMRYARDKEDAQDLLHEGYIKVYKNIAQFQFNGSFEGWVRRIMVNTAINHYHRNHLTRITDYIAASPDNNDEHYTPEYFIENNADAISNISAQELMQMVQCLSPAYKMAFNLYAIEGYTHKEIAEMLNVTEGTSKSNLAKARMKLQQMLKTQSDIEKQGQWKTMTI